MKVYGYPRSGNHLLMRTLWLTYQSTTDADYRTLFGAHFDAPPATPSAGNPPVPDEDGMVVVRDVHAVARSIWRMRAWFGLTAIDSFDEFLTREYSKSYVASGPVPLWIDVGQGVESRLGHDPMFAGIEECPLEHHARYHQELLARCDRVVRYEELIAEPQAVVQRIGDWFGLPAVGVILPQHPIGFNVRYPEFKAQPKTTTEAASS